MVTIADTLKKSNDTAYVGSVVFRLIDAPINQTTVLLVGGDVSVTTNAGGTFSLTLRAGKYQVIVPNSRLLTISVPDDNGTYTLSQLSTCDLTYVTAPPAGSTDYGVRYCANLSALKALIPGGTIKLAFLSTNSSDVGSENIAHWYEFYLGDATGADDIFVIADLGNTGRWGRRR